MWKKKDVVNNKDSTEKQDKTITNKVTGHASKEYFSPQSKNWTIIFRFSTDEYDLKVRIFSDKGLAKITVSLDIWGKNETMGLKLYSKKKKKASKQAYLLVIHDCEVTILQEILYTQLCMVVNLKFLILNLICHQLLNL